MKKGFTMIELIFVIVILGILAATAIPKLNATRDDARMVTAAQEADRIFSELGGYYTAQGRFHADFNNSTNVTGMTNVTNPIRLGNHDCLTLTGANQGANPGQIIVTIGTGGLCANLWNTAAMQTLSKMFYNDANMTPDSSFARAYGTARNNSYYFDATSLSQAWATFGTTTGINFGN